MSFTSLDLAKAELAMESKKTLKEQIETDWRLVLHDDNIHTIDEVIQIIKSVSVYIDLACV